MSREGFTVVYANVRLEDYARIKRMLNEGMTINAWLRGLINDDLEAAGEAPLVPDGNRWPPRRPLKPMALVHGTYTGYTRGCRLECCRAAMRAYHRKRQATGMPKGTA